MRLQGPSTPVYGKPGKPSKRTGERGEVEAISLLCVYQEPFVLDGEPSEFQDGQVVPEHLGDPLQLGASQAVGADLCCVRLIGVDRVERRSPDAVQEPVEHEQHEVVLRWRQLVQGAPRATDVGGQLAHAEPGEPLLQEQSLELIEHFTMPDTELQLGTLREQRPRATTDRHGVRYRHGPNSTRTDRAPVVAELLGRSHRFSDL